jgi:hypothetical protein
MIEMAKALEDSEIVSVLLPYGPGGHDFSLYLPDVFRSTNKIKMMLAVGAYAVTPEYLAKTFYTMQAYGKDRISLNLVAGRYSEHFEQLATKYYPGDTSIMDSHEKRVLITEKWMEKFFNLIKDEDYKADLAVVGSSDTTINIANNYTDYIIINGWMLGGDYMQKITNSKPIMVIDPLILEPEQDESTIEYHDYKFTNKPDHPFKGTYEEVKKMFTDMSEQHNIEHFMIHTDQKDVTQILRLVKELSSTN